MELIMLGTGNAVVTKCYNTCFCLKDEERVLLVDAGGGNTILSRLEEAGIPLSMIHTMFLTHAHTDHILGAVWLVRVVAAAMNQGKYEGTFTIFGHDEALEALRTICFLTLGKKFTKHIGEDILLEEVTDRETRENLGWKLQFFDIGSTKIKQFGFCTDLPNGEHLVCLGDEPYSPQCEELVKGADWMLCEAFCLDRDKDVFHPYEKHHSTALDGGRIAEELGIKNLVLYHTEDKTIQERKAMYSAEAAVHFSGKIYVPDDLEKIHLG